MDLLVIRAEIKGIEMTHSPVHEKIDHAIGGRVPGDRDTVFRSARETGANAATEQALSDPVGGSK